MAETYKYRGGITINYAKCTGCGKCYNICPADTFEFDRESHLLTVAYPEDCWYCGACIYDCPAEGALSMDLPLACL
jgi:NAD-dependent dihydropyrimidine dehydrogenase PreA subunit